MEVGSFCLITYICTSSYYCNQIGNYPLRCFVLIITLTAELQVAQRPTIRRASLCCSPTQWTASFSKACKFINNWTISLYHNLYQSVNYPQRNQKSVTEVGKYSVCNMVDCLFYASTPFPFGELKIRMWISMQKGKCN